MRYESLANNVVVFIFCLSWTSHYCQRWLAFFYPLHKYNTYIVPNLIVPWIKLLISQFKRLDCRSQSNQTFVCGAQFFYYVLHTNTTWRLNNKKKNIRNLIYHYYTLYDRLYALPLWQLAQLKCVSNASEHRFVICLGFPQNRDCQLYLHNHCLVVFFAPRSLCFSSSTTTA